MSFWHLLAVQNLSRFGAKKIAALQTVSMGKNPVGKIILSTFYPSWSAAVNDLTRTMPNC
ncbi:TPA: hypothetical protein MDL27_000698 [Escherichia coli]|nr:hypothetical protein [Escherichia coli]